MIRCCLCRVRWLETDNKVEPTTLPGGYRCTDHTACRERVRGIVAANVGLREMCDG